MTGMLVVSLRDVKLQILVLHRFFGMESHYICPFLSLRAVHKEIYKNAVMYMYVLVWSTLGAGQVKLELHSDWSPLRV